MTLRTELPPRLVLNMYQDSKIIQVKWMNRRWIALEAYFLFNWPLPAIIPLPVYLLVVASKGV